MINNKMNRVTKMIKNNKNKLNLQILNKLCKLLRIYYNNIILFNINNQISNNYKKIINNYIK